MKKIMISLFFLATALLSGCVGMVSGCGGGKNFHICGTGSNMVQPPQQNVTNLVTAPVVQVINPPVINIQGGNRRWCENPKQFVNGQWQDRGGWWCKEVIGFGEEFTELSFDTSIGVFNPGTAFSWEEKKEGDASK